jgi:hypothetical protein
LALERGKPSVPPLVRWMATMLARPSESRSARSKARTSDPPWALKWAPRTAARWAQRTASTWVQLLGFLWVTKWDQQKACPWASRRASKWDRKMDFRLAQQWGCPV